MSLSDKIIVKGSTLHVEGYLADDVEEAVKELKSKCPRCYGARIAIKEGTSPQCIECFKIDEIFGEKLI